MEKILVNLYVPSIQEEYDLFAPADLKVGELVGVFALGVQDLSNGHYSISDKERLLRTNPDAVLHPQRSLKECGIKDGTRLIMI